MSEAKSINELNADLFQPDAADRFSDPRAVRKKAMDYLARREYGSDELVNKLATAGFDPGLAAVEVERLTIEGLQSDRRYAESFVQSRINQGKGPVRIRLELQQRGLGSSAIEDALQAAGQDWFDLATAVRERKFGPSTPGDFADKARQMRFLQYRGFESDQVRFAVGPRGDRKR